MAKDEHNCKFYKGRIKDVTIMGNKIFCRRCHKELKESEIDESELVKIKEKMELRANDK